MELKKNPKADLDKSKGLFLLIGTFVALGIILAAFEYQTRIAKAVDLGMVQQAQAEEDIIPITRNEINTPPPPPPPPQQQVSDIIEEIKNDQQETNINASSEADQNTQIVPVQVVEIVKEEEQEDEVFFIVEDMPEFPGGELALRKYISENVQYPELAKENDIQGKVFVRFSVTKNGAIDKVSIVKSVDPLLDQEALRVVRGLPKWKPGSQRGKPVNVWYTVPINFQLN